MDTINSLVNNEDNIKLLDMKDNEKYEDKLKKKITKRGRKPKQKNLEKKVPKRRGRKPTGKIINVIQEPINEINREESLIIHLPITNESLKELNYDIEEINTNISNIPQKKLEDSIINDYEKKIKKLTKENKLLQEKIKTIKNNEVDDVVNKVDVNFIDIESGKVRINEKKEVGCWWCCHKFDNTPCGLPDKYYNNIYYVIGYFCSHNCAMAYNNELNDYKVWERNSLLKILYKKIYGNDSELTPAPPRQVLKFFGGNLTIDEFRKTNKSYRFILPPMTSMNTVIENDEKYNNDFKYGEDNLKLKRSKPIITSKFSIEKAMNIKILSK
jgi:hypothetical protein